MSEPKIHYCDQYSEAWFALRRGKATASEMHRILTPKEMKLSKQADGYIYKLLGDLYDERYPRMDEYVSAKMQRGRDLEGPARDWYEYETGDKVEQVGFIESGCGRRGCSPDGIIPGKRRGVELKNPDPETHLAWLMDGPVVPAKHLAQIHGSLIVSGYDEWEFVSHCPLLPPMRVVTRPNLYTEALRVALDQFTVRFQAAKKKLEAM